MASREVRYKVLAGRYELPLDRQWTVHTPEPRNASEAAVAVAEIIDKSDPELIVLVRIKE